jgi:type 1 glutamine amidotransferase
MTTKRILLLLGGIWHDFEGYTTALETLLSPEGWSIEPVYQMEKLTTLKEDNCDLVISYTCLGKHREGYNDTGPLGLTDEQITALSEWVRDGGKLLGIHSATVLGDSSTKLADLMGGEFIEHPPQFTFTVFPLSRVHPITQGVEAFSIKDEFYMQKVAADVQVHMVAFDRGIAHPMAWSKSFGKGKVAYLAPGHNPAVWNHPTFQKLTTQAIQWLASPPE